MFFLSLAFLPNRCRCRAILLCLITFSETYKFGRTVLDETGPSQRYLLVQYTTFTRDEHQCPLRHSNPQSQLASGRTPTP